VKRQDGYLPIAGYGVVGDMRTAALVGADGAIDWLCLPDFDSPWALGALIDARRGGRLVVTPTGSYTTSRRYLPDTNVLETTFTTSSGVVRVTDAMLLGGADARELVRHVECDDGAVGLVVDLDNPNPNGLALWTCGLTPGRSVLERGDSGWIVLSDTPGRHQTGSLRRRLDATIDFWRSWAAERTYHGPWRSAVMRSSLVLKLLTFEPTGAMVAAPTTSLPEAIGGTRNWDYRYCWLRDSSFAIDALLRLGDLDSAGGFIEWLVGAASQPDPWPHPFYRLDGSADIDCRELDLDGYAHSRPVREGNGAIGQRQLGSFGDLFQAARLFVDSGCSLSRDAADDLARVADHVVDTWREPDSSVWELGDTRQYTASKMGCWIALDRAIGLARDGHLPRRSINRWEAALEAVGSFIEEHCWSRQLGAYARSADASDLDAAALLGAFMDYGGPGARLDATIDRIRERLGDGPLVYRYSGARDFEGAFLPCSFWLAQALAHRGRRDEAAELFEQLLPLANDVGLYSEEIDPDSGRLLGNFPQALTHMALVNAAVTIAGDRSG
jgi:GH15 family glucan-1,4-alpha-glucosidase